MSQQYSEEEKNVFAEWAKQQEKMRLLVDTKDHFKPEDIRLIGGLDISFHKTNPNRACAYLTVIDRKSIQIVYEDHLLIHLAVPYKAGFLAFREVPSYLQLLDKLKNDETKKHLFPQVIMVDGCGILHPRGIGSATHLGVEAGVSTIGVSKTLFCVDGLDVKKGRQESKMAFEKDGKRSAPLIGDSGKQLGCSFLPIGCSNPIFVSIGHRISLDMAMVLVEETCKFRLPEAIRHSDIQSKKFF